jgi:hypothetical protein
MGNPRLNLLALNNFKNMQKKPFIILIMLLASFYITAFLNLPFAFIMSFCGLAYIGPVLLASAIIWYILPQQRKTKFVNNKIKYYLFVIATMLMTFLALLPGRKVIANYYLTNSSMAARIFGKTMLLMLILFVLGNFLRNKRIKINIVCVIAYIIFIVIGFAGAALSNKSVPNSSESSVKSLTTLPYLSWAPLDDNGDKSSVTIYDPAVSSKGINKYTSLTTAETFLFDMNGNVLYKWILDTDDTDTWHYSKLLENGDLIGICETKKLLKKMDWNSNTIWETKLRCHHEIAVKDDGTIYVLACRDQIVFIKGFPVPILNDYIAVISNDGKILEEISIFNAIKKRVGFDHVPKIYSLLAKPSSMIDFVKRKMTDKDMCKQNTVFDIFHNNTISIADKDIEGVCKKSDMLLSIRNFDLIAILDAASKEFVWTWGPGQLDKQHHPTFMENGNILIFDNGLARGYSRIVELNPKTEKIVWEYAGDRPESFLSNYKGSCQKLPNGNILITEACKGRIFEITPSGTVVWEYYNTHINAKVDKRASFYRAERIVDPRFIESIERLLSEAKPN